MFVPSKKARRKIRERFLRDKIGELRYKIRGDIDNLRSEVQGYIDISRYGKAISAPIIDFELNWMNKYNYKEEFSKLNLTEDYPNLIRNLDERNVFCLTRIIKRLQSFIEGKKRIELFSDELERIKARNKEYYCNIIKLSPECFAYKRYLLPIKHFEACVFYEKCNMPYVKNLEKIKRKDFIDAGGFIGDSAIVLSEFTSAKVYIFEPNSENYDLMEKTIKMNESKNIIPVKKGLGRTESSEVINCNGSCSSIKLETGDGKSENIEITSVDQYAEENNLDIGLIKADIEGFEQDLLRGAEKTIRKNRPTLLISIYHTIDDLFHIKTLIESWDLGYKFVIAEHDPARVFLETMLIAETE
ncbi:MAG: FkbM family methyltransferase [Helicobacteraceae bacterium]|jgi:FkbM family methyltransferase|nr:FkbM family methyltransferase [Helicobacteraceae bacterium]